MAYISVSQMVGSFVFAFYQIFLSAIDSMLLYFGCLIKFSCFLIEGVFFYGIFTRKDLILSRRDWMERFDKGIIN